MINGLHAALMSNKGREVQRKIIREMAAYAVLNFGMEEKYMQRFKYAGQIEHKAEHDGFIVKAADLKRRVRINLF